jgi:hypothetical protein
MPLGRLSLAAAAAAGVLLVAASCTNPSATGGTSTGATGGSTTSTTASTTASTSSTAASVGAGGGGGGATGPSYVPSGFSCSTTKPSLDNDVVPITSSNCTTSAGCHLAMQSGSGVYDQLVNRIAEECDDLRMMITPGDPEGSYVIHKLTGHNLCSPATTMPLQQTPLTEADIQTIYDWICEGCPQN